MSCPLGVHSVISEEAVRPFQRILHRDLETNRIGATCGLGKELCLEKSHDYAADRHEGNSPPWTPEKKASTVSVYRMSIKSLSLQDLCFLIISEFTDGAL